VRFADASPVKAADTILLWGLASDPPIIAVAEALRQTGASVTVLDQQSVARTRVQLSVSRAVAGILRIGDRSLDLATVKSIYLRPQDSREMPNIVRAGANSAAFGHALAVEDMMLSWSELTPALAVNRPSHMAANNSKPYQALRIESLGFKIPDTLITTDPAAAIQFWQQHGDIIYKSVSGIRSIVSRVTEAHRARFDDIASCPTQFQQFIAGTEYRVHVVGEQVFACQITSAADDYRYSSEPVGMQACELPPGVAARCRALTRSMKLSVAGIDLRCTLDGNWYCFEVNAAPGFTFFERSAVQPIAAAIAQLLMAGCVMAGDAAAADSKLPPRPMPGENPLSISRRPREWSRNRSPGAN
jgi:glutathione synthase/RimK-type ligase-like ATP-grasp enzyme